MACNKVSNILLRSFFSSLIILVITIFLLISFVTISSFVNYSNDKSAHIKRLETLRIDAGAAIMEQDFASFDLNLNPKLNQIRTIITHNSYKELMPSINYSIMRSFTTITRQGVEGQYAHNTLTSQLNNGIRGFELDIRCYKNGFRVFHIPILDQRTHSPYWELALEELLIWSNRNPNHIPITILLEVKNDPRIINPACLEMNAERLESLDKSIIDVMGYDKVITPYNLMNSHLSMSDMVLNNDWPTLDETKGKFIFLLHPNDKCTKDYIEMDNSLSSQIMVPMIAYEELDDYKEYASFVMHNSPDAEEIQQLIASNYIVRTRMDTGIEYDETRAYNAILSNAQLLTTDFAKDLIYPKTSYIAYIEDEFTIGLIE